MPVRRWDRPDRQSAGRRQARLPWAAAFGFENRGGKPTWVADGEPQHRPGHAAYLVNRQTTRVGRHARTTRIRTRRSTALPCVADGPRRLESFKLYYLAAQWRHCGDPMNLAEQTAPLRPRRPETPTWEFEFLSERARRKARRHPCALGVLVKTSAQYARDPRGRQNETAPLGRQEVKLAPVP
jgi:hypothetical protein